MKARMILIATISLCILIGISSEQRSLTATDVQELKRLGTTKVSPDNKYLVFELSQWKSNEGKTEGMHILNIATKNIEYSLEGNSPKFATSDSFHLFYLKDDDQAQNIYFINFPPTDKDSPVKLTDSPVDIDTFQLSGSGKEFAFSIRVYPQFLSDLERTKLEDDLINKRGTNTYQVFDQLMVNHWNVWDDKKVSNIFYQSFDENYKPFQKPINLLESINPTNSPAPPFGGDEEYDISFDGKMVAFTAVPRKSEAINTRWVIYLATFKNSSDFELSDISSSDANHKGRSQDPKFSSNNKYVYYTCMPRDFLESDYLYLSRYNILTGDTNALTKFFDYSVGDYFITENDREVVFTTDYQGATEIFSSTFINNSVKLVSNKTQQSVSKSGLLNFSYDESNKIYFSFVIEQSMLHPPYIALYKFKNNYFDEESLIGAEVYFDPNEKFNEEFFIPQITLYKFYGSANYTYAWIMFPINFSSKIEYPTAFLIHGGPEGSWGNDWSYRWNPLLWASSGYFVLMPNPEGSTGWGQSYVDAVRNNFGGAPFETLVNVFTTFFQEFDKFTNKDRVCAAGASYGGYMVNWIQGNPESIKFSCLVTHDGDFSELNMFYITDEIWYPYAENCAEDNIGCNPWDSDKAREGYLKWSPESRVEYWQTPHMIIHGGNDFRIPLSEGISAFTALQMKGIESKFIYFTKEDHWVLKPENSIGWYANVISWFDKFTK